LYLTFLVHDIYCSNIVETTLGDGSAMRCRRASATSVGSITLHDVAFHLLHQILDELWSQIVSAARLSRRDFHCHALALSRNAQGLVDLYKRLCRNVFCKIDYGTGAVIS
jgi:hypothetical protein